MPHTGFIALIFSNVTINLVTRTNFSDKRDTTIPRNSWNSKDAKRKRAQRRETSTSCKGLCCSFTSPWNDLGVWHFKRDECGSRISIHLHHSQLITGNLWVVAISRICCWSTHCKYFHKCLGSYQLTTYQNWPVASAFPQMEHVSFAELRELLTTKLLILPFQRTVSLARNSSQFGSIADRYPGDHFWQMVSVRSFWCWHRTSRSALAVEMG